MIGLTLSKLAKLAHVSVSTVSKAFSMSNEIHPETREMIFAVAKEHGCFKKYYKAKYPKPVIAILCPEFKYAEAVSAAQQRLAELGCEISVASTDFSPKTEMELLQYYDRYTEVDGVIIIDGTADSYDSYDLPIVVVSRNPKAKLRVDVSCEAGMREAIEYFENKQATPIAFVGEPLAPRTKRNFEKLCPQGIVEIAKGRFEKGGYQAMENLLKLEERPRALICAYDYMAMGAIRCIQDHGLSVPEDIAVMGINNTHSCPFIEPPLSSIDAHVNDGCRIAADVLLAYLMGEPYEEETVMPTKVCYRRSTEI